MIFQGQAATAGTNVTLAIPTHAVGDLIFMMQRYPNTTPVAPPAAGGTVPPWMILESSGANNISLVTTWARATATNHTSGTWTGNSVLCCLVLRPDAGKVIAPAVIALATGNTTATLSYPALTLTMLDGTSWGVRVGIRWTANVDVGTPPTGWTNRIIQPSGSGAQMSVHTRAALVAHPVLDTVTIGGTTGAYRAHTVEVTETILARMVTIA